jgi:hypothetical protein
MADNKFPPSLWYNEGKDGQPSKLGGIDKADHEIIFTEAKLFIDENNVIIYGYGLVTGKVKQKINDNFQDVSFDSEKLIQIRLPRKEGKGSTLYTQVISEWLVTNYKLGENESLVFQINLTPGNEKSDKANLEDLQQNLTWQVDTNPGKYVLRNYFPSDISLVKSEKLKDFNFDGAEAVKNSNFTKKSGFGNGQTELEKLNDRVVFLQTLIYPELSQEQIKEKKLGLAEWAKALTSLGEKEMEIINLIMK